MFERQPGKVTATTTGGSAPADGTTIERRVLISNSRPPAIKRCRSSFMIFITPAVFAAAEEVMIDKFEFFHAKVVTQSTGWRGG
jgi:hypothetical protein